MSTHDKVTKKPDAIPHRTEEQHEQQPETVTPIAGLIQNSDTLPLTPKAILQLQRTIGNHAVKQLLNRTTSSDRIQRDDDDDPVTIDKIPDLMATWPHDFATLVTSYPVAEAILALYDEPPARLTEKLRQCVVLHANAGRIRDLLNQAPEDKRGDWINKIQDQKGKIGLEAGTIIQPDDLGIMALMPDYAVDFFQRVMNTATEKWGTLTAENQADFADKVFNQEKGYDWAVVDIEQWAPAAQRVDLGKALSDALNGPSNQDPFTFKNVHVEKVGDLLTKSFGSYKLDDIATFCYSTLGNFVGKFQGLSGPIGDNEDSIKGALEKFVSSDQAKSIYTALSTMASDYG